MCGRRSSFCGLAPTWTSRSETSRTIEDLTYADLESNRQDWLRLMTGEQVLEFVTSGP
jgi:hypothetical protein